MIDMRKDSQRRHLHWQDVLAEVKKDLTHAEMKLAGQVSGQYYAELRGQNMKHRGCGTEWVLVFTIIFLILANKDSTK